jgi:hypothetical protein
MKNLMTWSMAAVMTAASVIGIGMARGDDAPVAGGPAQLPAPEIRMNDEQLSALLKGLGYTENTSKSSDGKLTYHSLNSMVVNFRYIIDISLQDAGATVYFSCPLKKIGEPEKVPADKLLALLSKNDDMAPMAFSYDASRKQMFLNYQIENHDLTPARMQGELDKVKHVLNSTYALWDTSKWPGGPQPAAPVQDAKK